MSRVQQLNKVSIGFLIVVIFGVCLVISRSLPQMDGKPQAIAATRRGRVVLTGSSTVAPLAAEIAKRFEAENPGIRVDVQTGGSSRGIADARRGLSDIGMVSRALKEDETDLFSFTIAQDGIAILLHRSNPVGRLSRREVIDIYTGRITNWKKVGGRDAPIIVVNKAEGRSTLELFMAYFEIKNQEIEADVVIGDNAQGIKTVAGSPNAIGYVSIGAAVYDTAQGTPVKLLPVSGIEASIENVRKGNFPITRPLNLVTQTPPTAHVAAFIDFARSPRIHPTIEEQYFVPFTN